MNCPSCGRDGRDHRMDCPEGVAGQQRAAELADDVRRRVAERAASDLLWFSTLARACEFYWAARLRWASPRALPISTMDDGDGTPSRGVASPARFTFAIMAPAVAAAEKAELDRGEEGVPIGRWLRAAHEAGWSYSKIAEWENGRWTVHQVERRMGIAHRTLAERWARAGIIPERAS